MRANREAVMCLDQEEDADAVDDIRALFRELWDAGHVLTPEKLKIFQQTWKTITWPARDPDKMIEQAVGRAEPISIRVESRKKSKECLFLEGLRREVYEQYGPAFNEVKHILVKNGLRRHDLENIGSAYDANRFLNWVRVVHAVGDDSWKSAIIQPEAVRSTKIIQLGREWIETDRSQIPEDYVISIRKVWSIFGSSSSIDGATTEELTEALLSIHAFHEQLRFVKGGIVNLPKQFWDSNRRDDKKVRRTLSHLIGGNGDFIKRLHDVLYDPNMKLGLFGFFCALELYGTVKPEECPPMNGRMAKALRFLGFDVRAA